MNTTDYEYKIEELLDPSTYKKLTKDPTQTIIKNVNSQIKQSTIPESFKVNKPETPIINSKNVQINLWDRKLFTEEQNVLAKGGNYAVTSEEISK